MSKWDDLIRRLGNVSGAHWGTVEKGRRLSDYPKAANLLIDTPMKHMPEPGTEIFTIDPHHAIGGLAYPDDLAEEAARRLAGSPYQTPPEGRMDALYLRPGQVTTPNTPGRALIQFPRDPTAGGGQAVYDVAGGRDDAIRTLLHELRHGTNTRELFLKRAAPSISNAYKESFSAELPRGPMHRPEFQRYLARPSEVLSYVAEAGDDFVASNKRLISSPTDANEAMAMWAENSRAMADPMTKGFYDRAYTQSPAVRKLIQDMLMRYYAVPAAAGAAAASQDQ
jgi:hypothetical protein